MTKLKTIRVVLALSFFIAISLYFFDFLHLLPKELQVLTSIQFIPALFSKAIIVLLALILLTFIFGRIYCSIICPAGILQDILIRISKKIKGKKKARFVWGKAYNILRYGTLAVSLLMMLLGSNQLISLLDPYSNFGRIMTNLANPLGIGINNALAFLAGKINIYSIYHISIQELSIYSLLVSLLGLATFATMTYFRGRLFCNTLCPVGAILSLLSRFSLFRIVLDTNTCSSCGACERKCKSECINSKEKTVDSSRCVTCFNCLSVCKLNSIQYKFAPFRKTINEKSEKSASVERRNFLLTSIAVAGSARVLAMGSKEQKVYPLLPPGSVGKEHFEHHCTACHLCIQKCPNQIIQPAGFEFGFNHFLKPHLKYNNGYCNYQCTICSEVCPTKVIQPLSSDEKMVTQIGIAHFDKHLCVAFVDGTDCGACSEHCPTQAVKMMPQEGSSVHIPQVFPDICIGCGGCEYICPVRPVHAIRVVAHENPQKAKLPNYEKEEEKEVDGFGF